MTCPIFSNMKYNFLPISYILPLFTLGSLPLLGQIKIDHHVHFFSPELAEDIRAQGYALTVPDSMITNIDFIRRINLVDRIVLISGGYAYSNSLRMTKKKDRWKAVRAENDLLAAYVGKYPNNIIGFYGLDPLAPYTFQELKRCHEELKLQGLKLHFHGSGVNLRDPKHLKKVKKIFDYAATEEIPILVHFKNDRKDFGPGDVRLFINEILDKNPGMQLIFAHMGGDGGFTKETRAVLETFAEYFEKGNNPHHIYFELSGVVVYKDLDYPGKLPYQTLAQLIRQIGTERVLFGSDYPVMPSSMYKKLLKEYLPLKEKELEQINDNVPPFFQN